MGYKTCQFLFTASIVLCILSVTVYELFMLLSFTLVLHIFASAPPSYHISPSFSLLLCCRCLSKLNCHALSNHLLCRFQKQMYQIEIFFLDYTWSILEATEKLNIQVFTVAAKIKFP